MFLLIHARIDLNQYYKKMVRLISISDLQYYCEEQEIVYISINRGYEDSYLYFVKKKHEISLVPINIEFDSEILQ